MKSFKCFCDAPVFPIPAIYNEKQDLDLDKIGLYLDHLLICGAKILMTTVGTSHFNLLFSEEILLFNALCLRMKRFELIKFIAGLPQLSLNLLKNEIFRYKNFKNKPDAFLIIYPDRYYDDKTIIDFYYDIADNSEIPIMIHGMFMRNASGGYYDYTAKLINEIMQHDNIIGIKEESSTFGHAFNTCKSLDIAKFAVICAGRSQERFDMLNQFGVQSFLAGIGSLFPKMDIEFYNAIVNNDIRKADKIRIKCEKPFFNIAMPMGWHKALSLSLKVLGFSDLNVRKPFPKGTEKEYEKIVSVINKIRKEYEN